MTAVAPPLISVIVPCRNPGRALVATLDSLWAQRWVHPEIVVVDGASTDDTPAWLETQRDRLAIVISEPDRGVYDAMNKGIARARGDWILFLGAGDRLVGETVLSELAEILPGTGAGVVAGEVAYDDGRLYRLGSRVQPLARNFAHHQGTFYRRSLFAEAGEFDVALRIMGDYDLNLRLWKNRVRFKPIPARIAACTTGGLSDSGRWLGYREEILVRHRYAKAWRCWLWDLLSTARWVRKKILRTFSVRHG
jgi:glycosyltransferase involved in cell wall biosynthesis